MLKRLSRVVFMLLLISAMALAQGPAPLTEAELVFVLDNVEYRLGEDAKPLVDALKETHEVSLSVSDSCLFTGKDKEYDFGGIVLGTYPILQGGGDMLETIIVLDKGFYTARLIEVGMHKDEVILAYGENYSQDYDQMTYLSENGQSLVFLLDLDTDTVIGYYMMRNSA